MDFPPTCSEVIKFFCQLLERPWRAQEDKVEGVMGTRNKGWMDWCCMNSTALLQGIKSGGGHDGWVEGSILLTLGLWMGQHYIQNPLLPQAENGNGDGFNDIFLMSFNLNSMFSGVAN